MSERQQLISRYVMDLCPPIAVRYRFHFLRGETDSSARQMLVQDLQRYSTEVSNPEIAKSISGEHSIAWALETPGESEADPLGRASTHFAALRLEAALKHFERHKRAHRSDPHYGERVQIHLTLGRWNKALSLAQKANHIEGIFLSLIAIPDFRRAAAFLDPLCRKLNSQTKLEGGLVSRWELSHLIAYVSMANEGCEETKQRFSEIREASQYDFKGLSELVRLFSNRSFVEFARQLSEWKKEFAFSYYIRDVAGKLENAIAVNVIENVARPFSNITITHIAETVGGTREAVTTALAVLIREGRLQGYVDRVDGRFFGTDERVEDWEMARELERVITLRDRFENLLWRAEYERQLK